MFSRIKKNFSHDNDQNVVELFRPVYRLLSLTGLLPYSIRFPKGKQDCKIVHQFYVPYFLCGIIMFVYVCTFSVLCLMDVTITSEGIIKEINFTIELLVVLFCSISSYFCAFRYRKVNVRILQRIARVWTDLSNMPHHEVEPILKYLRKLFAVPFLFWLLVCSPLETLLTTIDDISILEHLYLVLPEAVPSLVVMFFSGLLLMVVGLLKNIKNHCQSLEAMQYQNSSMQVTETRQHFDEYYRCFLNKLELAYIQALELKQEINKLFRAPIGIITIQCFHAIICEAHALYHELIIARKFDLFLIVDKCYLSLYCFGKFLVLAYTGSLLKNEVIQVAQALHRIPIRTQNQDLNLLMQIQHFSTLISFYEADISIYGFFTLDFTLLFNMIASMATYLIILVQFDS